MEQVEEFIWYFPNTLRATRDYDLMYLDACIRSLNEAIKIFKEMSIAELKFRMDNTSLIKNDDFHKGFIYDETKIFIVDNEVYKCEEVPEIIKIYYIN